MTLTDNSFPLSKNHQALLQKYVTQGRIPQALLISGSSGLGKYRLAKVFAETLLCLKPENDGIACGHCNACLLIKANTHPDFIEIKPEGDKKTIAINQIRDMLKDVYLKPQFDTYRTIIIDPADTMTKSAANAFLKCLEEPTERTLFILITNKANKLPATVRSRCQHHRISFPEQRLVDEWLLGQGIDSDRQTLSNLISKSLLKPQDVANNDLIKQRIDSFQDWLILTKNTGQPVIIAEQWQKIPETVLLNWLLSWVTDLIKSASGVNPTFLTNQDFAESLQNCAHQLDLQELHRFYDLLLANRQLLGIQINFQMMLEEILVQWQQLNTRT